MAGLRTKTHCEGGIKKVNFDSQIERNNWATVPQ